MKKVSLVISNVAVVVVLFISGCGNNSNSGNKQSTNTALNKGIFTDSPVKNLFYQTSSGIKGYTDQNGTFNYKTGDYVTFKLNNLTLGEAKASSVVTPNSFFMRSDYNLLDIAFVLQSLDTDGNISNGIQLPSPKVLSKISFNDINLSDATNTFNNITTIKSELKNKDENDTFPNMNFESVESNYEISSTINYLTFMKDTKKSFLISKGNPKILMLQDKEIYDNNKLIGNYEFDKSFLSESANIKYYTADNLPSDNITIDNSSDSASSDSLLDLNVSGNILKISDINQFGNFWALSTNNGMTIYQSDDLKSAMLLNCFTNQSFKIDTNEEFYITQMTANGKEEDGTIKFNTDGNVTITFGKKIINAFVSDDGNVYSKDNNSNIILDSSSILFDFYNDALLDNNYIISPEKNNINRVKTLLKNDTQTYGNTISYMDFSGGDSSSLM